MISAGTAGPHRAPPRCPGRRGPPTAAPRSHPRRRGRSRDLVTGPPRVHLRVAGHRAAQGADDEPGPRHVRLRQPDQLSSPSHVELDQRMDLSLPARAPESVEDRSPLPRDGADGVSSQRRPSQKSRSQCRGSSTTTEPQVEPHRGAAVQVVGRPSRISARGEGDPRGVHRPGQLLRRLRPEQATEERDIRTGDVEDERHLKGMDRAQSRAGQANSYMGAPASTGLALGRRRAGEPADASTSRSGPWRAGRPGRGRDTGTGTPPARPCHRARRRPATGSRSTTGPVSMSSVICPIAPLATSQSRQSSVFVPTMTSTSPPAPALIRSMGLPGTTMPSTVGAQGRLLATTPAPQRSGSGSS